MKRQNTMPHIYSSNDPVILGLVTRFGGSGFLVLYRLLEAQFAGLPIRIDKPLAIDWMGLDPLTFLNYTVDVGIFSKYGDSLVNMMIDDYIYTIAENSEIKRRNASKRWPQNKTGMKKKSLTDIEIEPKPKENNKEWLAVFNNTRKQFVKGCRDIRVMDSKTERQIRSLRQNGFTTDDLIEVCTRAFKDPHHIESSFQWVTIEFVTRLPIWSRYHSMPDDPGAVKKEVTGFSMK